MIKNSPWARRRTALRIDKFSLQLMLFSDDMGNVEIDSMEYDPNREQLIVYISTQNNKRKQKVTLYRKGSKYENTLNLHEIPIGGEVYCSSVLDGGVEHFESTKETPDSS